MFPLRSARACATGAGAWGPRLDRPRAGVAALSTSLVLHRREPSRALRRGESGLRSPGTGGMVRLALPLAVMLGLGACASAETVLERLRAQKAKFNAATATDAGKKAWQATNLANNGQDLPNLLAAIKAGDIADVAAKLDHVGTDQEAIEETDRVGNGALHFAAKILGKDAEYRSLSIGQMLVQKKAPMNVRVTMQPEPLHKACTLKHRCRLICGSPVHLPSS